MVHRNPLAADFHRHCGNPVVAVPLVRTGRKWCVYAAIVLGVACVGIYFFERWYVTELEVVEAEVPKLVAAVEADDVDAVLAFFRMMRRSCGAKCNLG